MVPLFPFQKFLFCFALETGGYVISVLELISSFISIAACFVVMILPRDVIDPKNYDNKIVGKRNIFFNFEGDDLKFTHFRILRNYNDCFDVEYGPVCHCFPSFQRNNAGKLNYTNLKKI